MRASRLRSRGILDLGAQRQPGFRAKLGAQQFFKDFGVRLGHDGGGKFFHRLGTGIEVFEEGKCPVGGAPNFLPGNSLLGRQGRGSQSGQPFRARTILYLSSRYPWQTLPSRWWAGFFGQLTQRRRRGANFAVPPGRKFFLPDGIPRCTGVVVRKKESMGAMGSDADKGSASRSRVAARNG